MAVPLSSAQAAVSIALAAAAEIAQRHHNQAVERCERARAAARGWGSEAITAEYNHASEAEQERLDREVTKALETLHETEAAMAATYGILTELRFLQNQPQLVQ